MAGAAKRKEVCVHAREEKVPLILATESRNSKSRLPHSSKRNVPACNKTLLERALAFDDVSAMTKADVEGY